MIKNGKMSKEERDFYREMIDNYVLKEHYERVKDEKQELQQRIDKAIEFIDTWEKYKKENKPLEVSLLDLLYIKEILGDKENENK